MGGRWLVEDGGPAELAHRDCGELVAVELRCAIGHSVCREELDVALRRHPRHAESSGCAAAKPAQGERS